MTARILVVDDLHANIRLLEARLAAEYYDVKSVIDARDVLPTARVWQPDAILLDIMMPEMDGIQVCRLLKAEPLTAHIPVIMVTALRELPDRLQALAAGADEFLSKPVENGIMLARLRSVLRLKRLIDEWRARGATASALGFAAAQLPSHAGQVLIADDFAPRAHRLQDVLRRAGIGSVIARREAETLEAAAGGDVDLVALALSPLAGDPLRTLARLRASDATRDTPLLLLAEPDQNALLIAGLDLGANDCLGLPFDETELLLRIGNHIRRKQYQDQLRSDVGHAIQMAATDPLTGLYNRRFLMSHLERLSREGLPLEYAVLMIDIDHFKAINDRYGHAAGDLVLTEVGRILRASFRETDLIARYGGEEFVALLEVGSAERPDALAERLRAAVEAAAVETVAGAMPQRVTVSIGVAWSTLGELPDAILERADRALYEAKRAGRNRVATWRAEVAAPPAVCNA